MWTSVGVERFELSTSRTRTVRSTGLSHTPLSPHIIPDFISQALRIQQHFLTIDIKQPMNAIIILSNSQACKRWLDHFIWDCRLKQLWIDVVYCENAQADGFAIRA